MKKWSVLFSALAAVCAAAAVWIAANCPQTVPVLLYVPEEAPKTVETVMDSICRGDFSDAETLILGNPDLGVDRELSDPVSRMVWKAYVDSMDYDLVGDCYATEDGLAQDVKIISLELDSATSRLGERARVLLVEGVENAEDVSEIYDDNNEYRESFVTKVLEEATRQALEEDVRYGYQIVPVRLVYSRGKWFVKPTREFLAAISGGAAEQEAGK